MNELELAQTYYAFRSRYAERDDRMQIMDSIVAGDWTVVDPDNEKIVARSPNLIQVALEDTAEAAGMFPTTRVMPAKNTATGKKMAASMEKIASGYLDFAQMSMTIPATVMDMAAFGFCPWVVWPDYDERLPYIEKRDPRHCYPEPGFRPGQEVRRCMFSRRVHYSQMPAEYQAQIVDFVTDEAGNYQAERMVFALVEMFTDTEITIAAMFSTTNDGASSVNGVEGANSYTPIILDRLPVKAGVCPVVIGSRFTLDGEFRGQFDQIVGVLEAHVRLMGLIMDYADQSVYSDIWVKDLIGELSWGGGAYIELGPQGAIGRVPPAVTSLNVSQDLDRLVDAIHLGGRWPKSRPGQIDQSIASAKFVEAVAGVMNTAIKCMAPSTRVLTEGLEYVPVGQLQVGDRLVAFDEYPASGEKRSWRGAEVLATGRDVLDSYRVTLVDGTEIECSAEHLWLTGSGNKRTWRTTEELAKRHGKYNPYRVLKLLDVWEQDRSWESGYLSGMFDGEGCLSMSGAGVQLGLDQKDNAALHQVEMALKELGFTYSSYLKPQGVWHLNILGGRREILRLLGTIRPQRLIDRFIAQGGADVLGHLYGELVGIETIEHLGPREVVTLSTSTETLVAEGFAHHNTYHQILSRMMEHALRVAFITDQKCFPGDKTVSGVLRNQTFVWEYNASRDIDLKNKVRVEYGLGLGRDPAQSAVLMLQYADKGYISNEFVQENIDGLTDVNRERIRADVEQFQQMIRADLLSGLQAKTIPPAALVEIIDARGKGEDLTALYKKYISDPQLQQQQAPAPGMPPGAVPPGGGTPPGGPPPPGGLPAPGQPLDGGPPAVPPPPDPQSMMSRLSEQAGPTRGSFLSVGRG